jgi:hypothetical protein
MIVLKGFIFRFCFRVSTVFSKGTSFEPPLRILLPQGYRKRLRSVVGPVASTRRGSYRLLERSVGSGFMAGTTERMERRRLVLMRGSDVDRLHGCS